MKKPSPGKILRDKTSRAVARREKVPSPPIGMSEVVRRERVEELISLLGSVDLEIDILKSRRRP